MRPASASALQEVVGQATKNINFLGMFNEAVPTNLSRWDEPWKGPASSFVKQRIRRGPNDPQAVWQQIHSIIRHPLADRCGLTEACRGGDEGDSSLQALIESRQQKGTRHQALAR